MKANDTIELEEDDVTQKPKLTTFYEEVFQGHNIIRPVLVPSFLYTLERELVLPILPLFAEPYTVRGDSIGLLVSCYGLGRVLGNVPGGTFVGKIGAKRTIYVAFLLEICGSLICLFANHLYLLMIGRVVAGFSMACFDISRQVYISNAVASHVRGRLSSTLGGIRRSLVAIAPVCSGFILEYLSPRCVFAAQVLLIFFNFCWCKAFFPTRFVNQSSEKESREINAESEWQKYSYVFKKHKILLLRVGVFCFALTVFRSSTAFLYPYQGMQMNLSESTIGFVVGVGYLFDFLMVPIAGISIDKYGRRFACFWSSIGNLVTYLLFAALTEYAKQLENLALPLFFLVSATKGLSNGISAGLVMTICQDVAATVSTERRGQLVAIYKVLNDIGSILGPIAIGSLSVISMRTTLLCLATFAAGAATWTIFVLVRYELSCAFSILLKPETKEIRKDYTPVSMDDSERSSKIEMLEHSTRTPDAITPS